MNIIVTPTPNELNGVSRSDDERSRSINEMSLVSQFSVMCKIPSPIYSSLGHIQQLQRNQACPVVFAKLLVRGHVCHRRLQGKVSIISQRSG